MYEIRKRLQVAMVLEHQEKWLDAARAHYDVAGLLKQAGENPMMALAIAYGCCLKAGEIEQARSIRQELQELGMPGTTALLQIYVELGKRELSEALLEQIKVEDPEQLMALLHAVKTPELKTQGLE